MLRNLLAADGVGFGSRAPGLAFGMSADVRKQKQARNINRRCTQMSRAAATIPADFAGRGGLPARRSARSICAHLRLNISSVRVLAYRVRNMRDRFSCSELDFPHFMR
jgi:hypothetical protein